MLAVEHLGVSFGGLRAVDDVSFNVSPGATTALVGPNGAGKTTIFNLVTGFIRPTAGCVLLEGADLTGWKPHRIARAGVTRTFQNLRLFLRLTALDNVVGAIPGQPGENPLYSLARPWSVRRRRTADVARAREWLSYVGLDERRDVYASELSYGQQKRLSIARALATEARLLLLDEPSSGLDPAALEETLRLISRLPDIGKTLVIVEHNLEVVMQLCDWLLFLDRGRLVAEGRPKDLFAREDLADMYFGKAGRGDIVAVDSPP